VRAVGDHTTAPTRAYAVGPIQELWNERALLASLVMRDLRARYAGSSVGLVWALASPLLQIVILTLVFSFVLDVRLQGPGDAPFPIVLAWALFPWIGFQEAIARGTTSLVDGGVMIKRMAFRPGILVAQAAFSAAVQQVAALALLTALMPLLGVAVQPTVVLCILPFALQLCLMIGLGWILGVLHVYFRDTAQVVVVTLQAWFYLTPIVYTLNTAPETLQRLLLVNPLCGIVETFRAFALGGTVPWLALAWSVVAGVLTLVAGARVLSRARGEIADLV
jgi:lipopolysaccharide transport system permease protein